MSDLQERKGDEYLLQAEKKLKSWSWGDSKTYDAAELFEKAGTAFKVSKAWEKGANAFMRLANLHAKSKDSSHDRAAALVEAANCYKKTSFKDAVRCLEEVVDIYMDNGRLSMAARNCKDIAEMCEKEEEIEAAVKWYERAADFYASESAQTSVNQMRIKVAEFSALNKQYGRAIEIYEQVAKDSASNNLLKYSVKSYLLNAGICQLCNNDVVAVQNALDKWTQFDGTFGDTREYKLIANLAAAMEDGDVEAFTGIIKEYDSMSRLDTWKTTLLLRVKESITQDDETLV
eukprot:TRINITY_DN35774_c0_g1_i1.p1 TRINITY_DN35774_c0_g1~~TRINITY_DN35774_c0_g1_i1.p1  ORF type:complete len:289 (+),score=76.10 TRINITY_DN35774_c0_g1_i1:348-1214(+)